MESNQRHEDFQSSALPTELSGLLAIQRGAWGAVRYSEGGWCQDDVATPRMGDLHEVEDEGQAAVVLVIVDANGTIIAGGGFDGIESGACGAS